MSKSYGVKSEKNEKGTCMVAVFGDGLTRVQTVGYSDGSAGIVVAKDSMSVPFCCINVGEKVEGIEQNALDVIGDKIVLNFDNRKSIDVVIARLEEAKLFLE